MPRRCAVPLCNSTSDIKGISVFSFPSDEDKIKLWKTLIHREDLKVTPSSGVCTLHFADDHILKEDKYTLPNGLDISILKTKPKLNDDAFPTIFANLPVLDRNKNNIPVSREKIDRSTKDLIECCVPDCDFINTTLLEDEEKLKSIFPFTKDINKRQEWMFMIPGLYKIEPNSMICTLHFEEKDIIYFDYEILSDNTKIIVPKKYPILTENARPTIFTNLTLTDNLRAVTKPDFQCCIPGCTFNQLSKDKQDQLSIYNLPRNREKLEKWLKSIKININLTENSGVCILHFNENQILRPNISQIPRNVINNNKPLLSEFAVPTIFPIASIKEKEKNILLIDKKEKSETKIEVCRCCRIFCCKNNLLSIFSENLQEIFQNVTSIYISENDELSTLICKSCFFDLRYLKKFKQQCLKTDKYLKKQSGENHITRSNSPITITTKEQQPFKEVLVINEDNNIDLETNLLNTCDLGINDLIGNIKKEEEQVINKIHEVILPEFNMDEIKKEIIDNNIDTIENNTNRRLPIKRKKRKLLVLTKNRKKQNTKISMIKLNANVDPLQCKYSYCCHLCNKKFRYKDNLDGHIREHEGKKLPCLYCSSEYKSWNMLKHHNKVAHNHIENNVDKVL